MANVIAPNGLQDYAHQGGSQRTEEFQVAWIASSDPTPIFNGDIVSRTVLSSPLVTGGFGSYITQGSSQTTPVVAGVFRGCEFFNITAQRMQFQRFWPGSGVAGTSSATGDIKAFIVTDVQQRFAVQASSLAVLGSSNIGQALSVAVAGGVGTPSSAGGNAVTGQSGLSVGSSGTTAITSSVGSAFPFRLVDFLSNVGPGNPLSGFPGVGSSLGFVNGMDNTTVGQVVIVEPLSWEGRQV